MPNYAIVATGTRHTLSPAVSTPRGCCTGAYARVRSLSSTAAPARARADDPPHRGHYHRGTMASPGLFYLPVSLRTQTNATIQCLTTPMYCSIVVSTGRLDAPSASHRRTVSATVTGASHDAALQLLQRDGRSWSCTETENDTETTQ